MLFSDFYIKYHTDLTFLYPNTTKNKHFHTAINNRYLHSAKNTLYLRVFVFEIIPAE